MKPILAALAAFASAFVMVRQVEPTGIMLYQGIAVGFLVAAGLWVFLKTSGGSTVLQASKDSLLAFCLIYSFVFTVPTTVDRSYSVRMIDRLAESGAGLSKNEINAAYIGYFVSGGGVDKRIQEQIATGTIKEEDGKFVLTRAGRLLAWVFRLTAVVFACADVI